MVWLPSLASLRAARQLIALDGHALVALERVDRRRGLAELWWPALASLAAIAVVVYLPGEPWRLVAQWRLYVWESAPNPAPPLPS